MRNPASVARFRWGVAAVGIVLEAITNVLKHSGARNLRISARTRNGNEMEIAVEDDGVGFSPGTTTEGIGLANMRARAAHLGGQLQILSRPGGGTAVRLVAQVGEAANRSQGEVAASA